MNIRAICIPLLFFSFSLAAVAQQFIEAPLYLGVHPATSVAAADLNGDGNFDLVLGQENGAKTGISIELGDGKGGFRQGQQIGPKGFTNGITIGDWNGDGIPDLATAGPSANTVEIFVGVGDGTFSTGPTYRIVSVPQAIASGDLNGDGVPDLVTANNDGDIRVLLGRGDATFGNPVSYPIPDFQGYSVALADLNRDGKLEVVAGSQGGAAFVLLGNGDGTLQDPVGYPAGSSVTVADLNGDGIPDLGASSILQLAVLLGRGDGTFAPATFYSGVIGTTNMAAADINGDGKLDLLQLD